MLNERTIAKLAADAIAKTMQDENNVWVLCFRKHGESTSNLIRIHMHGDLKDAAENLDRGHRDLSTRLRDLLVLLDRLPRV
jgi:hypothetical protein